MQINSRQAIVFLSIVIIGYIIICACSYEVGYKAASNNIRAKHEVKVVEAIKEVPVKLGTETKIVYVPKDDDHDADIQIKSEGPKVNVQYNSQRYEFETLRSETGKFVDGKLVITQQNEVNIDVKDIVNEQLNVVSKQLKDDAKREPRIGVGIGFTDNSLMAGLKYEKGRNEYFGYKRISGDGDNYFVGYMHNIVM